MSTKMIEQQLGDLRKRVATLEAKLKQKPRGAWREVFGSAKGDPLHRKAARLGALWRARENKPK